MDSGAQACIIGHRQLIELGFSEDQIQPSESFNIRSSTETVENCIKGKIKLKLYCLLKMEEYSNCGQFGKSTVEFLVADDKIHLQKIILGIPYLNQINAKMHFNKNICSIKCTVPTETGKRSVKLQLNTSNRIQLCNAVSIELSDNKSTFSINNSLIKIK